MRSILAAFALLVLCGCQAVSPLAGTPKRDDGSPMPPPAWTNVPEVYHGK